MRLGTAIAFFALMAFSACDTDIENRPMTPISSIKEYDCEDDCEGHNAGYEWAAHNGVTSTNDCYGNGPIAFEAGCNRYVEERIANTHVITPESHEFNDE